MEAIMKLEFKWAFLNRMKQPQKIRRNSGYEVCPKGNGTECAVWLIGKRGISGLFYHLTDIFGVYNYNLQLSANFASFFFSQTFLLLLNFRLFRYEKRGTNKPGIVGLVFKNSVINVLKNSVTNLGKTPSQTLGKTPSQTLQLLQ